jgi:retron-type reverse transcriptase
MADNLTKIDINEHCRLITFDIKDLYVNIPIHETLKITELMLSKENTEQTTKQIITLLDAILKQNYFEFKNNLYQPEKGVAMGSPISGIMAEIFLQYSEDKHIKHLLDTK